MSVKTSKFPGLHARMAVKSGDQRVIKRYVNAIRNLVREQRRLLPDGATVPMSNNAWYRTLRALRRNHEC
jgi:hypothetical protein